MKPTIASVGSAWLVVIAVLGAGPARSATHLVPEGHSTIQGALAAAASGDTVSIAPGTYYEHDLVWPPGVLILGRASSPEQVVIDGQFQGQIVGGENLVGGSEIGFLTLRGGLGAGLYGSGLLASGEAFIHDITIEDCSASHAIYGIGLCSLGKITISDCTLRRNTSTAAGTHGGGAYLASTGLGLTFSISNLEVHENDAEHGAGVYVNGSQGTISGLYAHDNLGSGLSVYDGDWGTGPRVENSLFISNEGSGVTFDASLIMQSCTVVDNGPAGSWIGGISCGSTWDHPHNPSITQCIVFDNRGSGISWLDPTSFALSCNDVYGNAYANYVNLADQTGLNGNLSEDPRFCGRGGSPYALAADSPCAPDNNGCGVLMGAFPVACEGTATESRNWSSIKALY